jgi:hypothetical protein
LESGEKLLFAVDTGSDVTVLDKSLEPKLGKRLSSGLLLYPFYGVRWGRVYQAPALYLGATRLVTSGRICTDDLREIFRDNHPVVGILGMDCLKHYCLQLDFNSGTVHFLDPARLNTEGWGQAFPLAPDLDQALIRASFFGVTNAVVKIDTGDYADGALKPGLFRRELQKQHPFQTNQWRSPQGILNARFAEDQFGGGTYTNLSVHGFPLSPFMRGHNTIGLQFLARHLVTLNFPKQTMYLQSRFVGPLPDGHDELEKALGYVNGQPAKDVDARCEALAKQKPGGWILFDTMNFLLDLKKKGQLPGLLKNDNANGKIVFDPDVVDELEHKIGPEDYPLARNLTLFKKGDTAAYTYTVVQAAPGAPWRLQRAWKAAPNWRVLKDYPIP